MSNLTPNIVVFGLGGAGGNALNNMIEGRLDGVRFVAGNTDAQALETSLAQHKIQLGAELTRGLGAGANPKIGTAAAEEAEEELAKYLDDAHLVLITAGMGGGTGTGAAPVVARMAKERGILSIGVVTKPFDFEGAHRMRLATQGIEELEKNIDTLIVIPNQNLFRVADASTTLTQAFQLADNVLYSGVRSITDLILKPGLVNLDFADIKAVMNEMGKAMMGSGEASGSERAIKAAEAAISNPLLDYSSMKGARGVLINITGGPDMTLFDVDAAANRVREEIDNDNANIIFGSTFNPAMQNVIRVSVVATGINAPIGFKHQDLFKSVEHRQDTQLEPQEPKAAYIDDLAEEERSIIAIDQKKPAKLRGFLSKWFGSDDAPSSSRKSETEILECRTVSGAAQHRRKDGE